MKRAIEMIRLTLVGLAVALAIMAFAAYVQLSHAAERGGLPVGVSYDDRGGSI